MTNEPPQQEGQTEAEPTSFVDEHEGESDLFPIVEMPTWVAPLIGIVLVLIAALAVWEAVR